MNRIDELIKKLCPNGVEYKKASEIKIESFWLMPSTPTYIAEGVPYITSKNIKNGKINFENVNYISEKDYLSISSNRTIKKNDLLITMIGTIGETAFVEEDIKFYGQNMYLIRLNEKVINRKFFNYYLTSEKIKNSLVSRKNTSSQGYIKAGSIENLLLPVPPLEVQCEIVHILDDFTLLSAELSAELKARQKQFEYYRTKLLSTDGKNYKLGEIADFKTGVKPKDILEQSQYEYINAGTTNSGYTESKNFKGDVVTTPSRGQGGIGFVGYQKDEFWLGPLCYAIWSKNEKILINKYLYYELSSKKDEILKRKNTGGVPALNGCDLKTIQLNVPSVEKQIKIVDLLDRFEKICENISSGLPAEIEARQKQYEYYRDKLLFFNEVKNNG